MRDVWPLHGSWRGGRKESRYVTCLVFVRKRGLAEPRWHADQEFPARGPCLLRLARASARRLWSARRLSTLAAHDCLLRNTSFVAETLRSRTGNDSVLIHPPSAVASDSSTRCNTEEQVLSDVRSQARVKEIDHHFFPLISLVFKVMSLTYAEDHLGLLQYSL